MYKWIVLALALWCSAGDGLLHAEDGLIARVGQSGEFLELEQSNGQVIKDYLPLYRAGGVRYFSVGVGLEERQAQYPPFSLKLVFTAGGKPYLAGVDVMIQPGKGAAAAITISREQVEGPWLFVDLPPGTYDISATYGEHKQALKGIKVVGGKQKTVHLRWTEDTGPTVKVPNE